MQCLWSLESKLRIMLCKYDELRRKTDRELIQVIDRGLDHALNSMFQAAGSLDRLEFPGRPYVQAARAHADAGRLISMIYGNDAERARLTARAEHLRKVLDRIEDNDSSSADVATIARSLWQARGCPDGVAEEDWFWVERVLKMVRKRSVFNLRRVSSWWQPTSGEPP